MQVESGSLGNYLRQERERQRVSLHEIAAATKIQVRFLEALEHDHYDRLPAVPFVVGFLRAYAQYLALDMDGILAAYRALLRAPEEPEPVAPPTPPAPSFASRFAPFKMAGSVVALGLCVVVVVAWLGPSRQEGERTVPAPVPVPRSAETAPSPPPSPASVPPVAGRDLPRPTPPAVPTVTAPLQAAEMRQATATASTLEPMPPSPGPASAPPKATESAPTPSSKSLVLEAKAVQDTWLRIEIDGSKAQNLLLPSGKSVNWEATERFRVTIGNVRGTRLALNGQEVALPQDRSNVARDFLLTRELLR